MNSFLKRWILIVFLFLLPSIAFARDIPLPLGIDLGDGASIAFPVTWSILKGAQGFYSARGDGISLKILKPGQVASLDLKLTDKSSVADTLIALYALPPTSGTITQSDVQKKLYGSRVAAVYSHAADSSTDELVVAILMSSGSPGYLSFKAATGQLAEQEETISAIIASFDQIRTPAPVATAAPVPVPTDRPGTGASPNSGSNAGGTGVTGTEEPAAGGSATGGGEVNCTVSVERANTAQLRVGPGTNRGAIAFLSVGVDVTVTGRIVLKDGSVWYQLDKQEAAPKGTSAAELWVAADQVNASGDCDHVGATTAPPVIPGNVAPPPSNNGSGNSGGGNTNTSPGLLPAPGAWVLVMDATTNASCQGGNNFPYSTAETFNPTTYGDTLVSIDSNSFHYSGDVFTRIAGTNSFTGTFIYSDGTPGYVRFNLVSTTTMTGSITVNYAIQGTACSETVQFVSNHG